MLYTINIAAYIIITFFTCAICDETGSFKPLGMQRAPEGHVEILEKVPSAAEFYANYVVPSKPVLFKGAAKEIPAFNLWTDDYLKKTFGTVNAETEVGKKEDRSLPVHQWSLKEFLDKYKSEDVYMVQSIPQSMRNEISILPCVSCGGFHNGMTDVVLWFSSGGTKSVLHNDAIDNINCIFSGSKDFYIADKKHKDLAHIDELEGGYSGVDVDAVNTTKYPGFMKLPWYQAHMESGDCLFIPFKWYHQVRSFGRNMAVNVWFVHLPTFNETDCKVSEWNGKYRPMNDIRIKPVDGGRNLLLTALENTKEKELGKQELKTMFGLMLDEDVDNASMRRLMRLVDANRDGAITKDELVNLSNSDLQILNGFFPSVGDPSEEGEASEGDQDEKDSESDGDQDDAGEGDESNVGQEDGGEEDGGEEDGGEEDGVEGSEGMETEEGGSDTSRDEL